MSTPIIDEVSTWLHYCQRGNITGVNEYIQNYIQVLNQQDKGKWNGLHYAAHAGHLDVVQALLAAKCNLDDLNGAQETALMMAVVKNELDIVLALVRAGADTSIKNPSGLTAIELAPNDAIRQALGGYDTRASGVGQTFAMAESDPESD